MVFTGAAVDWGSAFDSWVTHPNPFVQITRNVFTRMGLPTGSTVWS